MLKVENLRLGFTSGKTTLVAVDGISFAIAKGETFALLGESGCGKSATAQGIMRLLPVAGCILDGQVSLDGENLVLKKYFHIAFAADTPNGLVVPVVKNVDQKSVSQIATECGELAKKARDGKLGPADMTGACFTISSVGGIGGTAFSPIVNAPEVAILGVSKSVMKPVWNGNEFVPRLTLPLSLSADHRVIDGALATRFNVYLAQLLADMRRALI